MLPNGSFAVGLLASFTGVYCVLLQLKNRSEIAKYGRNAELVKFGDFRNFSSIRNYDEVLTRCLADKKSAMKKYQDVAADYSDKISFVERTKLFAITQ